MQVNETGQYLLGDRSSSEKLSPVCPTTMDIIFMDMEKPVVLFPRN
jgi:hypothetical protein